MHASRGKRERRIRGPPPPPPSQNWERARGAEEEKRKITLPRTVAFAQLFKKKNQRFFRKGKHSCLSIDSFHVFLKKINVPNFCRKSYQSANKEVGEGGEEKIER